MIKRDRLIILFFFLLLAVGLFFPVFTRGQFPFPGNYMLVWYEPWKSIFSPEDIPTIAHKAVADDVFRQLYPYKILIADVMRRFDLPFWNPYNGAGMPFLATMHVGFFTPFNAFFLLFPNYIGWTIFIIFQEILIFLFMYLYCRKLGFSTHASVFSSVIFGLSGFVIVRLIFGEYLYIVAFLPLLLYLTETFLENNSSRMVLLLPFVIFLIIVSGQPQIIFYVLSFGIFYLFYRTLQHSLHNVFFILLLYVFGIGLGSIQIVPTIELFQNAAISIESSKFIFDRFLLSPFHLVSILIPNYFGNQGTYNYWGEGDYIETIASVGLIPCFFAFIGLVYNKRSDKRKKFFFFAVLLTILATLDWFATRFFYSLSVPILSTGAPTRIFVLTTFSLAILAGYGFDGWINMGKIHKSFFKIISLFIPGILVVAAVTYFNYFTNNSCNNAFVQNCRSVAARNTTIELFVFSIVLSIFILKILFQKKKIFAFTPYIIILIIVVVGIYNAHKFLPFSGQESFYYQLPVLQALQEKTTDARVFSFGNRSISTDFATEFRYFDPNYYDPLYNKRYGELIAYANTGRVNSALKRSDIEIVKEFDISQIDSERRERLLSLLSVRYLLFNAAEIHNLPKLKQNIVWEDENWKIIRNSALPRAYLVDNFIAENNEEKILKTLFGKDFDPFHNVILEEKPEKFSEEAERLSGSVKMLQYEENKVIFEINSNKKTIFVLTDNYFPGWKAYIDKQEAQIYRANYTFRAITIPAGKHNIHFVYKPLSVTIGLYISGISILFYVILVARHYRATTQGTS